MEDLLEVLNSNFKIVQIVIENFTILNESCSITIEVFSKEFGSKIIIFEDVSRINIYSEHYSCSDKSSITTEDLSSAQMEGIKYKVAISEDVMTFYCKDISLN